MLNGCGPVDQYSILWYGKVEPYWELTTPRDVFDEYENTTSLEVETGRMLTSQYYMGENSQYVVKDLHYFLGESLISRVRTISFPPGEFPGVLEYLERTPDITDYDIIDETYSITFISVKP